jgi:hypothetical protein
MIKGEIDHGDIETLAQILEHEKRSHTHKRSLCFAMFMACFVCLVAALAMIAVRLAMLTLAPDGAMELSSQLLLLQFLAPLAAVALSFFGAWWAVQNCLNSIERTLFAARNQRPHLFAKFLEQIQCADKEKRRAWLEIIKSAVM